LSIKIVVEVDPREVEVVVDEVVEVDVTTNTVEDDSAKKVVEETLTFNSPPPSPPPNKSMKKPAIYRTHPNKLPQPKPHTTGANKTKNKTKKTKRETIITKIHLKKEK
jgi:hypothetical protein